MLKTAAIVSEEEQLILSTVSPGAAQKRLALAVVLGLLIGFVLIAAGPLGSIQTKPVAAFVPAYATAMFVCDSITAILLFAQFSILRSRAILVIASGYLFTALILIPWILAFPGVFAPNVGLIGGLQTTSWLYFSQHAGLPLFAIGYALSKDTDADKRAWRRSTRSAIALSVALTAGLVSAVAFICVAGEALLPRVVLDSLHLSPLWPYAGAPVALLSLSGSHRPVDSGAFPARSVVDGGDVPVHDRDTTELLSDAVPIQHRLVCRAGRRVLIQYARPDRPAVRNSGDLREAARRGPRSAS